MGRELARYGRLDRYIDAAGSSSKAAFMEAPDEISSINAQVEKHFRKASKGAR